MKRIFVVIFTILFVAFMFNIDKSEGKGGGVRVKGYYRKDGTYVNSHTRSYPKSSGFSSGIYPKNSGSSSGIYPDSPGSSDSPPSDCPPDNTPDTIYFKNGTIIKVSEAWVEGDNIKCIRFCGEISYRKDLIDRIEKGTTESQKDFKKERENREVIKKKLDEIEKEFAENTKKKDKKIAEEMRKEEQNVQTTQTAVLDTAVVKKVDTNFTPLTIIIVVIIVAALYVRSRHSNKTETG